MTRKQEAKELYNKFKNNLRPDNLSWLVETKQCTLICVNEMIKNASYWKGTYMGNKKYKELLEVKEEIEKL